MQRELTGGLPSLMKNELMGGLTNKWLSGCLWMVTDPKVVGFDGATSCLRKTQKKFESSRTLGCVRCEKLGYIWLKSLPPLNYKSVQFDNGRNG